MFAKFAATALLCTAALPVMAAECDVTIEGNDAMQFNLKEIVVDKSCKEFTVNLKHTGKLKVAQMGHNWVLTKASDTDAVAKEGMAAGPANGYLKANDERVVAHTDMIGGGETSSVTFDVSKLADGEDYAYFCSFPGHWAIMKGVLKVSS
ncbi:azurin [Pusillimonas sp. CC-YST705]|uniref:Azurin n=1 Tax=Mesopusillimonas faecipullorum TaxID=2755040 RepID=A0ABS8CAL9_9BURK|nr:azurin [Mesopusillimonas faecipullorum]MCB5363078.1 azurin [Mesopusillimonas faecipullorum]